MPEPTISARVLLVCIAFLFAPACSGAGASSEPPPATHEQVQNDAQLALDPQTASDAGTLLPLGVLSARSTGVSTLAITSCASTAACTGGTNTSTGPGVAGVSSQGKGVTGTTTFASTSSSNGQYGVYGQDSSASGTFDAGVYGLSVNGIGVSGKSTGNYGVRGTSTNNAGVFGTSPYNIGLYGTGGTRGVYGAGPIGVYGNGSSRGVYGNAASSSAIGVYGNSPSYIALYGSGVYGVYANGTSYAVLGTTSGGTGGYFSSSSSIGVHALSSSSTGMYASSNTGYAIEGHTGGSVGAYVTNANGNGADVTGTYIGVVGRAPSTGFPLVATDSSGNNLFYVTGTGDVYYHGGIHTFAAMSSGGGALAYSPQSTRPAIEDTGTAQLVGGRAVVMLDSTFARAIDTGRVYQVFLTPGGDTRGLYVASKSPSQFVVREVQGGHGTFSFDYHVYAIAMGRTAERMSPVQPNAKPLHFSAPLGPHPIVEPPKPGE